MYQSRTRAAPCPHRTLEDFPGILTVTSDPPKKPSTDDDEYDGPSKSSRKRAAHAAQDLGEELIRMRDSELDVAESPGEPGRCSARSAPHNSRGGLARQRQYIGKLMRDVDPEPIRAFLASRNTVNAHDAERFKRVEAWRERLIVEGAPALEELERWRPGLDRDEWARRVNAAREERARTAATGTAGRELFRALRALLDSQAAADDDGPDSE